jgi:UDP-N-acetylglucosamine acyltransferase
VQDETQIHSTALVHPRAVIGVGTRVGAFSIIEEEVVIGQNCMIQEHVVIRSHSTLGDEVKVFPFAVIGGEPQHLSYRGERTTAVIGNRVTLRESTTVHRGTEFGGGITRVGDDAFIMAYCHVAHDCLIGKKVIMANTVQLAGHVEVGESTIIGGQSAVAQFCRLGSFCYIGGGSILRKDLPPFLAGKGNDFEVQGINAVGLSRNGFSQASITRLKAIYKIFYLQKLTVSKAIEKITIELGHEGEVESFISFIKSSKLGFIR